MCICGQALKKAINAQRPRYAKKTDPGMPSSHASSLAYLSVYMAVAWHPEQQLLADLGLLLAAFLVSFCTTVIHVSEDMRQSELGSHEKMCLVFGNSAATLCSGFLCRFRFALSSDTTLYPRCWQGPCLVLLQQRIGTSWDNSLCSQCSDQAQVVKICWHW